MKGRGAAVHQPIERAAAQPPAAGWSRQVIPSRWGAAARSSPGAHRRTLPSAMGRSKPGVANGVCTRNIESREGGYSIEDGGDRSSDTVAPEGESFTDEGHFTGP